MFAEMLASIFPFLEVWPYVRYVDGNGYKREGYLNYEICMNATPYTIIPEKLIHSFVTDFKLYCKKLDISMLGTSYFIGVFFGSFSSSIMSDSLGRKKSTLISTTCFMVSLIAYFFNNNIICLYIHLTFTGFFSVIMFLCIFVNLNEQIAVEKRFLYSNLLYLSFSFGGIIYTLILKYINNWRLTFLLGGMGLLMASIPFYIYVEESPRYLLLNGKVNEFIEVLIRIAKKNKLVIDEITLKNEIQDLIDQSKIFEVISYKMKAGDEKLGKYFQSN